MSRIGFSAASVYLVLTAYVLIDEARNPSGGWISLHSLLPALVTFPISFPLEWMGLLPDLSKGMNAGTMVFACSLLIYYTAAKLSKWFISQQY